MEICSSIENIQRALTLSYSDTMRKKEIDYTNLKNALDAVQSSFFCL